ncbi:MAG: serine/threonine-protein kinase PknG [Micrococcales bacterium]|nr:serine/threonine-protein kinase PknG [Micrococcales bacterium]
MNAPNVRCLMPGCTGTIDDGYCNVCGSPVGAAPPPPAAPSSEAGARTARTSSSRLASQALGSARIGSGRTRRLSTSATRLRGRRMGAGLTTVPPTPPVDPLAAVLADPVVPERKRVCFSCGNKVGQGHDGTPGRTDGFCPTCGTRFDFRPTLAPGDLVGGQYQVVGCLAHGGQGWIYLAQDRNVSDRWVVLKGLLNSGDADAVAATIAERRFLAEVTHPLIVEIYNFATLAGAGYIVMEYVGGTSLKQILTARSTRAGRVDPLPVDQALAYVLEILPAFSYLHDRGLLYCDFKPDNLISQGETVKLIDLGGVRRTDDDDSAIFGTIGFQAPEVPVEGPSVASDVFTIGRTLATMVLDFRGNTTTYATTLPPIGETPLFTRYDSFYRLLAKACAADPNDRFGCVDELRVQMLGVLREVVMIDRGLDTKARDTTARTTPSALFAAPTVNTDRPLLPSELPALRPDEHDPMYGWLTGVTVADPAARFATLADAPQATAEVLVARAQAAVAAAAAGEPAPEGNAQTTVAQHHAHAKWSDRARQAIETLLDLDPWDWRAAWLSGLLELTRGAWAATQVSLGSKHGQTGGMLPLAQVQSEAAVAARASFNAVYGQVPGELAPKLALATTCELSGELDLAESLYLVCANADANYTSPAAFGLARIRQRRGDLDGALAALDLVSPTRGSYPQARMIRAQLLAGSGRGLVELARSLEELDRVPISSTAKARLRLDVLKTALAAITAPGAPPAVPELTIGGYPATEPALRDGVERACRDLAHLTADPAARFALVDDANRLRRWTLR